MHLLKYLRFVTSALIILSFLTGNRSFAQNDRYPQEGRFHLPLHTTEGERYVFKDAANQEYFLKRDLVDAIAREIEAAGRRPRESREKVTEEEQQALQAVARLIPHIPRILELQSQIQTLSVALSKVKDEDRKDIYKHLSELESQMDEAIRNNRDELELANNLRRLLVPQVKVEEDRVAFLGGKGPFAPEYAPSRGVVNYADLQPGDVLFRLSNTNKLSFLWAMQYSHCGIYVGEKRVYEADLGDILRPHSLTEWQTPGEHYAVLRCRRSLLSQQKLTAALNKFIQFHSNPPKPYNLIFYNKERDDRLYCSQVVYKMFQTLEPKINVDSNDPRYLIWFVSRNGMGNIFAQSAVRLLAIEAVAPDEIFLSPYFYVVEEGVF